MPNLHGSSPAKRQRLTLAQLAAYDDILTDALVDHVFYWTTVPKNRSSYHPSRGIREDIIAKIVQEELVVNKDLDAGEERLLAADGLRRFHDGLKTDRERDDFRRHLRRYLQMYLPDCPWEVGSTNRYTIVTHEACITARRHIKRNETIKYLSGIQVNITPEEEKEIAVRKKDFSIVVSSRNKCTSLFMGPARFANHDCRANAKLMTTGHAGIEIIATRPIDAGDEITVTYGENYFGEDNCECLCQTCEKNQCNGWQPEDGAAGPVKASVEDGEERHEAEKTEVYSLRLRRRDDSIGGASSRTPSVTPVIRPRVYKTRRKSSRLGSVKQPTSAAASPAPDAASPADRKRPMDVMATPPITPSKKKLKHLVEEAPGGAISRGSSASGSVSSSSAEAAETDMTSPEEESPEPGIQSRTQTATETIKGEQGEPAGADGIAGLAPASPQMVLGMQSPPSSQDIAEGASSDMSAEPTCEIVAPLLDEVKLAEPITVSIETVDEGEAVRVATEMDAAPRRKKHQRRVFIKQTTPPARLRTPGDYVLTPLLLSEPEMAWIQCTNCSMHFVQQNAYFTRASCPRCERHSKLYGYVWPKTDKAGLSDTEERVLDHRTVHRFLDPYEERRARGRKGFGDDDAAAGEDDDEDEEPTGAARDRQRERDAATPGRARGRKKQPEDTGLRRSGRVRKMSCKLVGT